jgi:hypothetical protein
MPTNGAARNDAVEWLLTSDQAAVRHLALRDLADPPADPATLAAARQAAHAEGPVAEVLAAMHPEGYWEQSGHGYGPKYRSTVWSLILLAQLGASAAEDARIGTACGYLLDHALTPQGQFSTTGTASGTVDCLQGNLCWALSTLGYDDPRLETAYDWMARSVTGDGVAPMTERDAPLRYYAGKCGPGFLCGANNKLACAWGAVKVMLAFGVWPAARRTPLIERAMTQGVSFLLDNDPAHAGWPNGWAAKPSGNWWKFGFPVFYVTDLLQVAEALVALGYGADARLAPVLELIRAKQDGDGRWPLEYGYAGKTWGDYGALKQPSPWVTLRALRVLKGAVGNR